MDTTKQKQLKSGIRSAWSKAGREIGLPMLCNALARYRDIKEYQFNFDFAPDDDGVGGVINEFKEFIEQIVTEERPIIETILRADKQKQYVKSQPVKLTSRQRRYTKCLETQLLIVEFVLDWHTNLSDMIERRLKKRITQWDKITTEWNEAFPYNRMTVGTLSRNFRNAIQEEDVQQAYFDKKQGEILEAFRPALEIIRKRILACGASMTPTEQALLEKVSERVESRLEPIFLDIFKSSLDSFPIMRHFRLKKSYR